MPVCCRIAGAQRAPLEARQQLARVQRNVSAACACVQAGESQCWCGVLGRTSRGVVVVRATTPCTAGERDSHGLGGVGQS